MILLRIPAVEIMCDRRVSQQWKQRIDAISCVQWKDLYHKTVCPWLSMTDTFDWRTACVKASKHRGIPAMCTWNSEIVHIRIPWLKTEECVVIGMHLTLRQGITVNHISNYTDYVYHDTFRLRSISHSCRHHGTSPCLNCIAKKTCLRLRQRYYIRNLTPLHQETFLKLLTTRPDGTQC